MWCPAHQRRQTKRGAEDQLLMRSWPVQVGQVAVVWVQALSQWCQACDPLRRPVREWALVGPLTCEEGRPVVDALGPVRRAGHQRLVKAVMLARASRALAEEIAGGPLLWSRCTCGLSVGC
ncbi:hypothetical protein SEVIR_1G218900v4 [Setaria viridis]|uniref:Uncharacterized protein n=1 Tax=Setaria viridis TaxID=4556 RepID=A0A4U6WBL7_SETVI|nr:hypothetical protein SEVIR_1G218900v2 [Setaria viridis]